MTFPALNLHFESFRSEILMNFPINSYSNLHVEIYRKKSYGKNLHSESFIAYFFPDFPKVFDEPHLPWTSRPGHVGGGDVAGDLGTGRRHLEARAVDDRSGDGL
jgi:hypothetical protein